VEDREIEDVEATDLIEPFGASPGFRRRKSTVKRPDPVDSGPVVPGAAPVAAEPVPAKGAPGGDGRRRLPARRPYEPYSACPGCGRDLGSRTRKRAFRVLGSAGETFAKEVKGNYVAAIENFVSTIAGFLDILVDSRAVRAEPTMKVLMDATMAIHAPKIGGREDADPVGVIQKFLNASAADLEELGDVDGDGE